VLVFTRRQDESIIVHDDVVLTVLSIQRNRVRIGIAAPIGISIHRKEVYEATKARQAADEQRTL
jgi:carbon storage regulator